MMADPTTLSSQASISGGNSQTLRFRPGQPGQISIASVPLPYVAQTETGLLAMIVLRAPGSATPLASMKFPNSSPSLLLIYSATPWDLATPGDWECDVTNETDQIIEFSTNVTFPSSPDPVPTATMDLGFLNQVLATLVDAAAIQISLQGSSDGSPQSSVLLTQDMADLLGIPNFLAFNLPDKSVSVPGISFVVEVQNLNSDPGYPVLFLGGPP